MLENNIDKETNLKDEVKRLNDNFNKLLESGKIKGVKLKKTPSKFQAKNNWIYILYINENGEIKPMKQMIEEGTVMVEGIPRLATSEYRLSYLGKPAIILPAWSVKPFSPTDNYEETVKEQMTSQGYKLLLNRIELGGIKPKRKISGAIIFGIIIAIIVVGYLLLK